MQSEESGWSGVVQGDWTDLGKIRALLDAGADPIGKVWGYRAALHVAAEEGSPEVVAEMAGRASDIEAEDEGRTALWTAVYRHRPDNARALVEAGADPWRPMMDGWSPGRLSLAGPTPDLFDVPADAPGLTAEEIELVTLGTRAAEVFAGRYRIGLGLACVTGVGAEEAVRRLSGTPVDAGTFDADLADGDIDVIGVTDVPGGCVVAQPWGYAPQMPGVLALLSKGTVAYGLYDNPKSGAQGSVCRDGVLERRDLQPGYDSGPDAPSREVLAGYLAWRNAVAYTCAVAGLLPPDVRAVDGPPDVWMRLPKRDWWVRPHQDHPVGE